MWIWKKIIKEQNCYSQFQSKNELEVISWRLANARGAPSTRAIRAGAKLRPQWQVLRKNWSIASFFMKSLNAAKLLSWTRFNEVVGNGHAAKTRSGRTASCDQWRATHDSKINRSLCGSGLKNFIQNSKIVILNFNQKTIWKSFREGLPTPGVALPPGPTVQELSFVRNGKCCTKFDQARLCSWNHWTRQNC